MKILKGYSSIILYGLRPVTWSANSEIVVIGGNRMKKTRILQIRCAILIALMVVGAVALISPVAAYGTGTGNDTHDQLTDRALIILDGDNYDTIKSEIDSYLYRIKDGSYQADHGLDIEIPFYGTLPLAASEHYHGANSHDGLTIDLPWPIPDFKFRSAGSYAKAYFEDAVSFYRAGDKYNAYYKLGYALHVLQDLTVPHHAMNQMFAQHTEYESDIWRYMGYANAISSGGIYSFSSYSGHYNDDTPWGWVDYNAHYSDNYYTYVNGGTDDWDYAASKLLPRAVKTSAGFLRFFYAEANRGRQESDRSSSLSGTGATYTYYVDVPWGAHTTVVAGNEPDADFDLFVKWGSAPTTSSYDARGFSSDSLEHVTVTGRGRLYVMVRSWSGSGYFKSNVVYGSPLVSTETGGSLSSSGSTQTHSVYGTVRNGFMHAWAYLAGPDTADFDLYLRWGSAPTTSTYDDRGFSGRSQEICDKGRTSSKTLYTMARAYRGSGSYRLLMLIF